MAPQIQTGSRLATGVILPVLPILCSTDSKFVVTISAGNLYAIAYLG